MPRCSVIKCRFPLCRACDAHFVGQIAAVCDIPRGKRDVRAANTSWRKGWTALFNGIRFRVRVRLSGSPSVPRVLLNFPQRYSEAHERAGRTKCGNKGGNSGTSIAVSHFDYFSLHVSCLADAGIFLEKPTDCGCSLNGVNDVSHDLRAFTYVSIT